MKYAIAIIAVYSLLKYINISYSEFINAKVNMFENVEQKDLLHSAILKNILIIIMAVTWPILFLF